MKTVLSAAPRSRRPDRITVSVSIDTEEDNWGSYAGSGATTENISHLLALQEMFGRWGVRPTYLVNYAPLSDPTAVSVLRRVADRDGVEIGGHCHPWNTPPYLREGEHNSMMCTYTVEENEAKLREIGSKIRSQLGVDPKVFRAGRWGFGRTVAEALLRQGYDIDSSVTPFIDWTIDGGPDYTAAPHRPYRFACAAPLEGAPGGALLELPPTIGFFRGAHRYRAKLRTALERSMLARARVVGLLDRLGALTRRWLSPEWSSADEMIKLAEAWSSSGETFLHLTFHSCALLPGATPFVSDALQRASFLERLERFFEFCRSRGMRFRTLSEAAVDLNQLHSTH